MSFFKFALPKKIFEIIDKKETIQDKKSFLDEKDKEKISDIIIKTKIRDNNNEQDCDIYFLIEHKSYKDKQIYLQFLKYCYLMWLNDFNNKKSLRVIIPIYFYTIFKNFILLFFCRIMEKPLKNR